MSVIALCGLPGSGKTLMASYLANKHYSKDNSFFKRTIRKLRKQDIDQNVIFSTYPIKLDKNVFCNQFSLYDFARWNRYDMDSDFFIDELQLYYDSLDFAKVPQTLRNTFQLHRHFGINNIFVLSQHPSRIVKQVRVLISEYYEIMNFYKIPLIGIAFFRYNIYYNFEDFGKPVNVKKNEVTYRFKKKILFFNYKKIYKRYDTKYFRKLVEDKDPLPKVPFKNLDMALEDIMNTYRLS